MKRLILLLILAFTITSFGLEAKDGKNNGDEVLRKSEFLDLTQPGNTSFPRPFNELNNPNTQGAISTGYYFVDSESDAGDEWRPSPEIVDTTVDPTTWFRILSGPRQAKVDNSYREFWEQNPDEGLRFFRNPALPDNPGPGRNFFLDLSNSDCFDCHTDSTDDAIAGPIPIKFPFYFNGLRFDSFYVGTNGIVVLSNRRYHYDNEGNRVVPAGSEMGAYDPMSNDWFARGRNMSAYNQGLTDPTDDNYGYRYSVCGGNPEGSRYGGIRTRPASNPNSNNLGRLGNFAQVIAPFWADMHLSQYNAVDNEIDDHGKVYYKRDRVGNELIIYFINVAPARTKYNHIGQGYNAPMNRRLGHQNYTSSSAQVKLDRRDSSVTITYESFIGNVVISGRGYDAKLIFRASTTSGVRGFARHINYGQGGGTQTPWAYYYEQMTHYHNCLISTAVSYPSNYLSIKFKQWKNTLRVVDIQYRIRSKDPDANLDFDPDGCRDCLIKDPRNYELLAGHERLGAIQPVALIQNISNNIQGPNGINFQPQEMNFRARFLIKNQATERIVYNRFVPIDSLCLSLPDSLSHMCKGNPNISVRYVKVSKDKSGNYEAEEHSPILPNNYNGIPPYGFVQVMFPPFEPNEFLPNHIGRLQAFVIAEPQDPQTGRGFGDEWPFDDTTSVQLFSMNRLDEFKDDVTHYHIIGNNPMPSTLKWVNIEATIASGDDVSHHPLPPRGEFPATNNLDFQLSKNEIDFTNFRLRSPVIEMNRKFLSGLDMSSGQSDYAGDEIRSFPINLLRGEPAYKAVLSVSFQRTAKQRDWPRGWSDNMLVGIEPRPFINGDDLSWMGRKWKGGNYNWGSTASYYPDEIRVELMAPSPDGIHYITNVEEDRWNIHPRRGGLKPITGEPAYRLYGSNGHFTGFLESDPDSSLEQSNWNDRQGGFRGDAYDEGIDYEFQKAYVAIPDTFINAQNQGAKNFRFRIRVYASNDKKCLTCIPDDDDQFYVDNVKILRKSEITDIEVSKVSIRWPYTVAPASQAEKIPVSVKLSNNTSVMAPQYWVKVKIFKGGGDDIPPAWEAIYCETKSVPFHSEREDEIIDMPKWNARDHGPGEYKIVANIIIEGGDLEPFNDTTYTDVELQFGDVFAYDPVQNPRNNVEDNQFTGVLGRGLTLYGAAFGGVGNIRRINYGSYTTEHAAGARAGSGSGQIAAKFKLVRADTIKGFQAFYGRLSASPDNISLAIYTDRNDFVPNQIVPGSLIYKLRGYDDERDTLAYDEYVTHLLDDPVILPAGTYWVVVAQLGHDGIELGASKTRMGMRTTNCYVQPIITQTKTIGQSGFHLMIEKNFRKRINIGQEYRLINDNFFAVENTRGSNEWMAFMPTVGNPAYAHLDHFGAVDNGATVTLSRGGWIPMLRPYLGEKPSGEKIGEYDPCPEDIPVELTSFDGVMSRGRIDLMWETASETNNYGFYVERRVATDDPNAEWNKITMVKSKAGENGNSNATLSYTYKDYDVTPNTTYQYRLRQLDIDGTEACECSDIISVTYDQAYALDLKQNSPNPFSDFTNIKFTVPERQHVKVEVLDIYGNVVYTVVDDQLSAGTHDTFNWKGIDQSGKKVANGTYICRLTAGDKVRTNKMTITR